MNAKKIFILITLHSILLFTILGCNSHDKTSEPIKPPISSMTPSVSATRTTLISATPAYIRYTPGKNSVFRFEFTYPSYWSTDNKNGTLYGDVYQFFFFKEHPKQGVLSSTGISLVLSKNEADNLESRIDDLLKGIEDRNGKVVEDKVINIDGISARWLSVELPPQVYNDNVANAGEPTAGINILLASNHDLYRFTLILPVYEKGSEFEQEFQAMIQGMKYIPLK